LQAKKLSSPLKNVDQKSQYTEITIQINIPREASLLGLKVALRESEKIIPPAVKREQPAPVSRKDEKDREVIFAAGYGIFSIDGN
jgi:hypothetical protein